MADTSPRILERIARFVVDADSPVDGEAGEHLRIALIDTLGVTIAGTATDLAAALAGVSELGAEPEPAGGRLTRHGGQGALTLGALAHALDYDDSVNLIPGHPSAPVLAALLATLPATLPARQLLDSYALGIEVSAKLGRALGADHYLGGWHATSTVGCFGAVAALGRLHRLDAAALTAALGIAASSASGIQANFGTMTKPLHAGLAARNAVHAVALAVAGVTASPGALEGSGGFFETYGGPGSDPVAAYEGLGAPWVCHRPGISLKRYPCCYATHRAIEAVRLLVAKHAITADDVGQVTCEVPVGGLRPLRRGLPSTGLEGKFSLEYVVAAYLVDGEVGLDSFTDERVGRLALRRLMQTVRVRESPECSPEDTRGRQGSASTRGFVRLTVACRDGSLHSVEVRSAPGSRDDPQTRDDVAAKFTDCLRFAGHPPAVAAGILDQLTRIGPDDDVAPVLRHVRAMTRRSGPHRRETNSPIA